jgi:hypothetical protein
LATSKKSAKYRNICRIDSSEKHTHAWRVTFQRKGKIALQHFSDGVYGGKKRALDAAFAFRNQLLTDYSDFEHLVWVRTRLRKNNTSGIPGVGRYESITNVRTGHRDVYWLACWTDEHGLRHRRKFRVSRYGERQAKRLAIAERKRQLLQICELKAGTSSK